MWAGTGTRREAHLYAPYRARDAASRDDSADVTWRHHKAATHVLWTASATPLLRALACAFPDDRHTMRSRVLGTSLQARCAESEMLHVRADRKLPCLPCHTRRDRAARRRALRRWRLASGARHRADPDGWLARAQAAAPCRASGRPDSRGGIRHRPTAAQHHPGDGRDAGASQGVCRSLCGGRRAPTHPPHTPWPRHGGSLPRTRGLPVAQRRGALAHQPG